MNEVKVSVIVPIYNAGNKLKKCIKSILNQTFADLELILVNDGSTDNSLDICRQFEKNDKRVFVLDKVNEGSIKTRRRGVESTTSGLIMFVDADDWIDKVTIEIMYNKAVENDADVTVCEKYKVLGDNTILKKKIKNEYFYNDKLYVGDDIKNELVVSFLHGHAFPANLFGKLYKKEFLINSGKYLENIRFLGEDLYYNLEIFLKAKTIKVVNMPLYYYRTGGITSRYMSYLFDDMVSGYKVQKEVIDEYFQETRDRQFYGISLMLLNTFKTCLQNLFNSKLSDSEIEKLIYDYTLNECVIECINNKGSISYFDKNYLDAIKNKDVKYLFLLGKSLYKKRILRKYFINMISKIS